jgi:hypothetical protein
MWADAVESAETPKSKHKTMCYNNDEIKEKKNIIQNGSEKKKKKERKERKKERKKKNSVEFSCLEPTSCHYH